MTSGLSAAPDRAGSEFARSAAAAGPLLDVANLTTEFRTRYRAITAVDGVSFTIGRGETVGLVGESGSGKSVTALSIARLIPSPPGRITSGRIVLDGTDLLELPERQMRDFRGRAIGFIFQDPMTSLNPTLPVGYQIGEPLRIHEGASRAQARRRAVQLLGDVGIPRPAERIDDYPHQFSGGMRQRVVIAIALACSPSLLIADEPTTALDVTVQAQILTLIRSLTAERGTSVLLITHDLGVAAGICDRVNVMYAGQLVESAPVDELFAAPLMPYTSGLMACLPRIDDPLDAPFTPIAGQAADLTRLPRGCRFGPRCPARRPECDGAVPPLSERGPDHWARCLATEKDGWL